MLVLSRKLGEQIVIGDGIVVTIVGLSGQRIRVGVEAPTSVAVRRSELPAKCQTLGSSVHANAN